MFPVAFSTPSPPIPASMIASEPSLHSERWQYLDSVWNSSHPSQPGGPWRSRGPVGTSGIQGQRQISCWLRSAAQDPRMSSTLYYLELIFRKRPFRTCQKTAVASLSGLFLPALSRLGFPTVQGIGLCHPLLLNNKEKEKKPVRSCSSSSELCHRWEGIMVTPVPQIDSHLITNKGA